MPWNTICNWNKQKKTPKWPNLKVFRWSTISVVGRNIEIKITWCKWQHEYSATLQWSSLLMTYGLEYSSKCALNTVINILCRKPNSPGLGLCWAQRRSWREDAVTCNASCHEAGDAGCDQSPDATVCDVGPSVWGDGRWKRSNTCEEGGRRERPQQQWQVKT